MTLLQSRQNFSPSDTLRDHLRPRTWKFALSLKPRSFREPRCHVAQLVRGAVVDWIAGSTRAEAVKKCIYCGADKDLTVDHVPPKLLLMRPYPPNLITVPACETCNKSFQKDDEYTRTMLAVDVRASKNAAAQSNLPAVLRSLQRPDARGFAEYLAKQANSSVILGQDGSPMGQVFELDKARVNKTGERLIRAVYFIETGTPVPSGAMIRVGCRWPSNQQTRTQLR